MATFPILNKTRQVLSQYPFIFAIAITVLHLIKTIVIYIKKVKFAKINNKQ